MVRAEGFEPPTSCSQSTRATRLRYARIKKGTTMPRRCPQSPHGGTRRERKGWSRRRDLNPEPDAYKATALPLELRRQKKERVTVNLSTGKNALLPCVRGTVLANRVTKPYNPDRIRRYLLPLRRDNGLQKRRKHDRRPHRGENNKRRAQRLAAARKTKPYENRPF